MDKDLERASNAGSSSATWEWRRVRIRPAPQAESTVERSESHRASLLPWPRQKPLHVVVKWRGGSECWVEVRARGRVWRRPGTTALYDLIVDMFGHPPV